MQSNDINTCTHGQTLSLSPFFTIYKLTERLLGWYLLYGGLVKISYAQLKRLIAATAMERSDLLKPWDVTMVAIKKRKVVVQL